MKNEGKLDQYQTAIANGFSEKQARDMEKWNPSEFVKRISDMVPLPKNKKKTWVIRVEK
jgi:hypothetical protein